MTTLYLFLSSCLAEGARKPSGVSFIRAQILFLRAPSLWPNHLPIPSHWGSGFQHIKFEGRHSVHCMAFLVLMVERYLISYHLSGSKSLVLNVLPFNSKQPQAELRSKFGWFDCKTDTFNHHDINTTWFKHIFDDESICFLCVRLFYQSLLVQPVIFYLISTLSWTLMWE